MNSGISFVDKGGHNDWIDTASSYGDKGGDYYRDRDMSRNNNRDGHIYDDSRSYDVDEFRDDADNNDFKPVSVIMSERSMFQRASTIVRTGGTGPTKPQTGVRTYFSSVTDVGSGKTVQRSSGEDSRMQRHDTVNLPTASSSSETTREREVPREREREVRGESHSSSEMKTDSNKRSFNVDHSSKRIRSSD